MNIKTFCMNRKISYEEIALDDPVVNKIYEIKNPSQEQIIGIPDGCVDIQALWKDGQVAAYVCGSFEKAAVSVTGFYDKCLGIKFNPGVTMECFHGSMCDIIHNKIDLDCFFHDASDLCEIIGTDEKLSDKTPKIQQFFLKEKTTEQHMAVSYLFDRIENAQNNTNVKELAEYLGYSQRHVERIFKYYTGFSVKKYESIIRMQNAFDIMNEESSNQNNILDKLGYYDQAHFIHEFKRYTLQTPGTFSRKQNKLMIV